MIATILLLAATLWSARGVLTPVVCVLALFVLLWPAHSGSAARRVLAAAVFLLACWMLARARAVVYPALVALALAFLLDPIVDRLCARRVPRALAALAVLLPAGGLMLAFAVGLLPVLLDQARTLIERLPGAYSTFVRTVVPWLARWLPQDGLQAPADLGPLLPSAERILRGLFSGLLQIGRGLASAAQIGSFFLLTPILTYYLLVDFDRLRDGLRPHLPPAWAERGGRLAAAFQDSVSAWLKAQMLVALIVATLTIAGFALIGLPYALLLGFLAGLLNLVPVLGFWVGAFLAASAALFTPAPLPMLGKTALVLASVQLLEQNLLSPRIVGRRLGAKPVVLLLVMLLLSVFLGVAGVLLAAPVIGLARGIWEIWGPPTRAAAGSEP